MSRRAMLRGVSPDGRGGGNGVEADENMRAIMNRNWRRVPPKDAAGS